MPFRQHIRKKRLDQKQAVPASVILINRNEDAVVKTRIKAGRLVVNHSEVVR